jgi:RHS repeat-associated protein
LRPVTVTSEAGVSGYGEVVQCSDYLPFGRKLSSSDNGRGSCHESDPDNLINSEIPQGFTGKERDPETGLDYFGARYMSAAQGRFTSSDPENADASLDDPQSWNAYAYARNNPLKYIDPTGEKIELWGNNPSLISDALNSIKAALVGSPAASMLTVQDVTEKGVVHHYLSISGGEKGKAQFIAYGQVYVDKDINVSVSLERSISKMIDSAQTVQFFLSAQVTVRLDGGGEENINIGNKGGGVALSAARSKSGLIQVAIDPNKIGSKWNPLYCGRWACPAPNLGETVAHEFGHAYAFMFPYPKEKNWSNMMAINFENAARLRGDKRGFRLKHLGDF